MTEEEEEEVVEEAPAEQDDVSYWKSILGDAYEDHIKQLKREEDDRRAKLGVGKRVRKRVNYSEGELLQNAKISEDMKVRLSLNHISD